MGGEQLERDMRMDAVSASEFNVMLEEPYIVRRCACLKWREDV